MRWWSHPAYTNTLRRWYVSGSIFWLRHICFNKLVFLFKTNINRKNWTLRTNSKHFAAIHPRSLTSVHNQRFCMIINHSVYIPGGPLAIKAAIHHKQTMAKSSNQTDSCFKARRLHLHFLLPASSLTLWHAGKFVSCLITCKFQTDYPPVSDMLVRNGFDLRGGRKKKKINK